MKIPMRYLLIFLLFNVTTYAQSAGTFDSAAYFPIRQGDAWTYDWQLRIGQAPPQTVKRTRALEQPIEALVRQRKDEAADWDASIGRLLTLAAAGGPVGNVAQINLSGYGLTDAAIGYHYQRWTMNLTVRNVFDKYAFRLASGADRIYPEKPRHAILSVTTHF